MPVAPNKKYTPTKAIDKRPLDIYFDKYAENHQNPTNKLIHWISVPLIVFSVFGLFWALPFPYLKFLGRYNGFINWGSFLIAFSCYYYYKLSPVLSYLVVLVLFGFSYGIIALADMQKSGGPALWLVCMVILVMALAGQFVGHKIEGRKTSFSDKLRFLLIGPIWMLHFLLKGFNISY